MKNQIKYNEHYEKFYNVCKWPECDCVVPYYAFSHYNRIQYCDKLIEEINKK